MPIGTLDNSKSSRNAPPCSTPPRGAVADTVFFHSFWINAKLIQELQMYAGFRLPNAFLLSALKSPFRAFRQAPFIGCLVACGLLAPCPPATAGGFRHPPASARRSRVLPSVICRQGLRKCLSAPLPSVPSVSPSAPSASVARGRLRASPWLKTPAGVPRLKTLASSPPRFPPCRNPFSRLRSKRGGFRRRPHKGGSASVVAFPPPRLGVACLRAR